MSLINFQLVTPERTVLSKELDSLSCPTTLGQITLLPNHEPLVATLVPGELAAKSMGETSYINVTGGFVQVDRGGMVIVLADAAEHDYEIDLSRAEAARKRAQQALAEVKASDAEYAKVSAALERSLSRLRVARKRSGRKNPITGEGVFKE